MNERINNLRLESGISQLKDDPRLVVVDKEGNIIEPLIGLEKFAKLIIRECMEVAHEYDAPKLSGPGLMIGSMIEQHFGIEE